MLAFTFPGQGSQRSGMGLPWVDHPSWEVAGEASEIAGRDLTALLLEAPMEELTRTANAQLATFVMSLVVLDAVERLGLTPAACAGHSLGEYTALVASGALSLADGTSLVIERGDAMQKAADDRPGTMAALIGIADDDAEAACQRAESDVWVANYNAPGQVVISGTEAGIAAATGHAKDLGARKVLPIPVSGAFHTPMMLPARTRLRGRLDTVTFHSPRSRSSPTSMPGSTPTPPNGRACYQPSCAAQSVGGNRSKPSVVVAPASSWSSVPVVCSPAWSAGPPLTSGECRWPSPATSTS